MTGLTALVLAGSRPGGDPFAASFGVAKKALIPVGFALLLLQSMASAFKSYEKLRGEP